MDQVRDLDRAVEVGVGSGTGHLFAEHEADGADDLVDADGCGVVAVAGAGGRSERGDALAVSLGEPQAGVWAEGTYSLSATTDGSFISIDGEWTT